MLSDLPLHAGNPNLAFDGNSFGVAWQGNPGTGGEVGWVRVNSQGTVMGPPVPLSASNNTAGVASVRARSGGGFALAWPDGRSGDTEIRFVELNANGQPLAADVPITADDTSSTAPSLVIAGGAYAAAWLDNLTDTTGEVSFRVFCRN
jgi:hypothetical protein